ncbi:oligonucleotide/oligosaccharide-binding fold domain-containing protein, partial [Pseudomonas aeruginosa]
RQLTLICRELKLPFGRPAKAEARKPEAKKGASADNEREVPGIDYAAVHKAILSGLLSQIGQKAEEGDYLGARQRRFWIHPSSGIARKRPQWIMAAELVETTKLFARMVAKIEPDWL